MAKFREVAAGRKARKPYTFETIKTKDGESVSVDIVVLVGDEEGDVNAFARAYSLEKGGTGTTECPSYQLGEMAKTLALSVLDCDVKDSEERFFADEREVLAGRDFGREGMSFLYQVQKSWQREIAPGLDLEDPQAFMTKALEVAKVGLNPFLALKLSSQLSYVHYTANLLSSLLTSKSLFSLLGAESGEPSKRSSPSESEAP